MAYDFKREFRDLYQPKTAPALVDVPAMTFAAVAGAVFDSLLIAQKSRAAFHSRA